jgi:hypothetical protein
MTTVVQRPMTIPSHKPSFDHPLDGASESLVLECDCKAKLVLDSHVVARLLWRERFDHEGFICSACEKGFIIAGVVSHRYYSWMEDYLQQLEGKEAREAYYTRLL